jgi:T5SS/PEP-CTERM-associated repeat protein
VALCAVFLFLTSMAHADIVASGDVSPEISTWTSSTLGYIGRTSSGIVEVNGVSLLTSGGGLLGHDSGATGTATVTGTGSTWTNTSSLSVGNSGSGTLNVEAGGQVSNTTGYLGFNSGSSGTVTSYGWRPQFGHQTRPDAVA